MANGKVCTGFSKPYVAKYANSSGTVTYSGGMPLARGVSVELSIETGDDSIFYADNIAAETAAGTFTSGTATLTVDGLKEAARKLISGTVSTTSVTATVSGSTSTVTFDVYDDAQVVPYCGVGFIARYMEDGVESYMPVILRKCSFSQIGLSAATQEEEIDFQTQELEASILRDDSATHQWQWVGHDVASEAIAEAALKKALNVS